MPSGSQTYRGRFAPSPTGPLHFGSLIAAVGSYLDALHHDGEWLVRIEDIDPPREQGGAAASILKSLELHGFEWFGPVLFQSTRTEAYEQALHRLAELGATYLCSCSRRDIRNLQSSSNESLHYAGTCRNGRAKRNGPAALRILTNDAPIEFTDRIQGTVSAALESADGDFVIRRKDGLFAYQLAVVVDDEWQGITDIVRGVDLLDSTPRQIHLQRQLGMRPIRYAHLPIAADARGKKLSKQAGSPALDDNNPSASVVAALAFLGQQPPAVLQQASIEEVWQWARENWQLERVSGTQHAAPQWGSAQ